MNASHDPTKRLPFVGENLNEATKRPQTSSLLLQASPARPIAPIKYRLLYRAHVPPPGVSFTALAVTPELTFTHEHTFLSPLFLPESAAKPVFALYLKVVPTVVEKQSLVLEIG